MMAFSNVKMNHKRNNLTLYLIVKTTKFQLKISSTACFHHLLQSISWHQDNFFLGTSYESIADWEH